MKLDEAIMQVEDLLRGNNISRETKVRWLSELDGKIPEFVDEQTYFNALKEEKKQDNVSFMSEVSKKLEDYKLQLSEVETTLNKYEGK